MPAKKNSQEKPLTLSQLSQFFNEKVEPRFYRIENDLNSFRSETQQNFGFLFKKFEDLHQEYIVINHQMKRLETSDEILHKNITELQTKLTHLQAEVNALKQRLMTQ